MENSFLFPSAPQNVDPEMTAPSPNFKKGVVQTILGILFFILCYFILLTFAILLCILCVWGGISLIIGAPGFVTLFLGAGVIGLGLMTLYFLLKFVFKSNKIDLSNMIEVDKGNHPKLYEFIRRTAEETGTKFPHRIYLSYEVNASVFYNSGFWTLFFPVKKNLMIGLGLVNSINMSELKSVIAHEFGHFSQRSTVIGRYVYNVNKVIFNMLYDNEGYDRVLRTWASISNWFVIFGYINVAIVRGFQSILQVAYKVVNLPYLKLSREMEFNADAVSASVTGSASLISALRRVEIADGCMNEVIQFYGHRSNQDKRPQNLFKQQLKVFTEEAKKQDCKFVNGLPLIDSTFKEKKENSKIRIKDLWSTHPDLVDREQKLLSYQLHSNEVNSSSWDLFDDAEKLQESVTRIGMDDATFAKLTALNADEFWKSYHEMLTEQKLPAIYNEYYEGREIEYFNVNELDLDTPSSYSTADELYSGKHLDNLLCIRQLQHDMGILESIVNKQVKVALFEYDGTQYKKNKAQSLALTLHEELQTRLKTMHEHDADCFIFHYQQAKDAYSKEKLKSAYEAIFKVTQSNAENLDYCNELLGMAQFIYQNPNDDNARAHVANFKIKETGLKEKVLASINNTEFSHLLTITERETLTNFFSRNQVYLFQGRVMEESFDIFMKSVITWATYLNEMKMWKLRQAMEYQAGLI